jgi:hypothetical protein
LLIFKEAGKYSFKRIKYGRQVAISNYKARIVNGFQIFLFLIYFSGNTLYQTLGADAFNES